MIEFLGKGVVIGLSVAVPIGPVALLCIRNTIAYGLVAGTISGVAASIAYAIYGAVAGFGLTVVSNFLIQHKLVISLLGGAFLIYLGIRTWRDTSAPQIGSVKKELKHDFVSSFVPAFVLALTNPMTIVSFIAIFAAMDLSGASESYVPALALIIGIFGASAIWCTLLCAVVSLFRHRVTPSTMVLINKISGALIMAFGLYIGIAAFRR